jgi:hypothetical protein
VEKIKGVEFGSGLISASEMIETPRQCEKTQGYIKPDPQLEALGYDIKSTPSEDIPNPSVRSVEIS